MAKAPHHSYPRAAADWYVEAAAAVEGLFDVQRFTGWVWDPACGIGTIPKVCEAKGLKVIATDLVDRGYGLGGRDFLKWEPLDTERPVENIICNPPFSLADEFIRQALKRTTHKVAMLLPLTFLEGKKRRWIFDETPLAAIHPFAERVNMPPGEELVAGKVERKGGIRAFAWLVWDHDWIGPPIVRRIERALR